jgi:hypothetical protein
MKNPYWHDEYKPHLIDRTEIRSLCFEINNIFTASMMTPQTSEIEEDDGYEFSRLEQLCFTFAEAELSRRLLKLALLVRTLDDTFLRDDSAGGYVSYKKKIEEANVTLGAVYTGSFALTIRECSNKIIHAEDVRPVYYTEDDRTSPSALWGMDGTLELEGKLGRSNWSIVIYLPPYLEAILELIEFEEK